MTELMVAVSLMSLIVFALYTMFNQVQKALRANVSQVDSTERGRSVLELVSKELEGARVSMRPRVTNFWIRPQISAMQPPVQADFVTNLALTNMSRTNIFDFVYYQAKADKAWRGVGFMVLQATNLAGKLVAGPPTAGMGSLYRYETPEDQREFYHPTASLFGGFLTNVSKVNRLQDTASVNVWPAVTNLAHVADGVVHFKVTPYDTQGRVLSCMETNHAPGYRITRSLVPGAPPFPYPRSFFDAGVTNAASLANDFANVSLEATDLAFGAPLAHFTQASFRSNALPAYVELELGVLEPDAMRRYEQFLKDGDSKRARDYLQKRISGVQIFRKRIPFRTVVP